MVRRYRRTYRRNRVLSKANIYSNRGAKSQSKQIAALNRRVNYLAKYNKPEIRTIFRNFEHTFTNSTLSSNYDYTTLSPWSGSYYGDDQADGTFKMEGNFCRSKFLTINLVSQWSDNWRDTIASTAHDSSAGYRIVILQRKIPVPLDVASLDPLPVGNIFNLQNSLSSSDENLTMPLITGITSEYKILYSKTFTINRYHPTRLHKINISGKRMLNFTKEVSTTKSAASKGHIYVIVLTGGLHYDTDYDAQIKITASVKLGITDN